MAVLPAPTYNRIGTGYDATRRADPYIQRRLLDLLGVTPAARYLDLGCGTGNYAAALAARSGARFCGADISIRMLSQAPAKSAAVGWILADGARLPFPDTVFDGVYSTVAIHHFPSLRAPFREAFRVLKGGRYVIFTATPDQTRGYWLNHYFPRAMSKTIEQDPSLGLVSRELSAAGFASISTELYDTQPDLQDFFLYSGKYRPEIYLDPKIRAGISTFAMFAEAGEVDSGCARLADDIRTGRITEVIDSYRNTGGDYLFVIAQKQ